MKKLFTLCFFVFALFFTANTNAQDKIEINKTAFEKTDALRKSIKFNTEATDVIYEAYKQYYTNMAQMKKSIDAGKTVTSDDQKKAKKTLIDKIKASLTEEQFELYKTLEAN